MGVGFPIFGLFSVSRLPGRFCFSITAIPAIPAIPAIYRALRGPYPLPDHPRLA